MLDLFFKLTSLKPELLEGSPQSKARSKYYLLDTIPPKESCLAVKSRRKVTPVLYAYRA